MKANMDVPTKYEDVCGAVAKKRRSLQLRCGLWCAAVIFLEYIYLWSYFAARISTFGSALIAVFLLLSYPIKAGILKLFADRGWQGVVRDVKKKSYIHFRNFWARSYTNMTTRFEGHLYLYGREGRSAFLEKRFPIRKKFILRGGGDELPYQVGDTIRCYRGTAYPVIVRRPGIEGYPPRICVFCGKVECDRERSVCDFCGYSLITPEETVMQVEYGI